MHKRDAKCATSRGDGNPQPLSLKYNNKKHRLRSYLQEGSQRD